MLSWADRNADGSGTMTIDELLRAVQNALAGHAG
jgi:hypothetical protein